MNKSYLKLLIFSFIALPVLFYLLSTQVLFPSGGGGFLQAFYGFVCVITYIITLGCLASCVWQPQAVDFAEVTTTSKSPKWVVFLVLFLFVGILGTITGKKSVNIYNISTGITKDYEQKTQETAGYIDEMWKSFAQQKGLADTVKDVFLKTVTIIMDARKDAPALAWKWANENTNIDQSTYTTFYSDLSKFIADRRLGYRNLEYARQELAKRHNMLIDTFPNNIYNKVLNRPHIVYKYAMLSDSTNKIIETGVENLK